MMLSLFWTGLGIAILLLGAELLVRGASRLALLLGMSPLVVGLTVVAFGTSSPEAAVSVWSAIAGKAGLAAGNAVGSNIFNILGVLGLSAVIAPLAVSIRVIREEVPILIGVSGLFWLLASNGILGRLEGGGLLGLILLYTGWVIRRSTSGLERVDTNGKSGGTQLKRPVQTIVAQIVLVVSGITLLLIGSDRLVTGATAMARMLNVSEPVIGLTVLAVGTSLPELATSVVAVIRGERDIAVGNVVGSNVFNLLFVLGLSSILVDGGLPVPDVLLQLDIPVMMAATVLTLPIVFSGSRISRNEGFLFLAYYALYMVWLGLSTKDPWNAAGGRVWVLAAAGICTLLFVVVSIWNIRSRKRE